MPPNSGEMALWLAKTAAQGDLGDRPTRILQQVAGPNAETISFVGFFLHASKEKHMFPRLRICAVAILAGVLLAAGYSPVFAKEQGCATLRAIDTNNDGTVDMDEARRAASGLSRNIAA